MKCNECNKSTLVKLQNVKKITTCSSCRSPNIIEQIQDLTFNDDLVTVSLYCAECEKIIKSKRSYRCVKLYKYIKHYEVLL